MLNKALLMGRLVADPELRHTQSGVAVASFRLAVERDFKDKDTGERAADFLSIVAWRSTAEFVSRYFAKGRMAVVEGRIQVREYTNRDGDRRYATEIVADHVYFGDSKKDGDGDGYRQNGQDSGYAPPPQQGGYGGYGNQGGYGHAPGGYGAPSPGSGDLLPGYGGPEQFGEVEDDDGDLPF